MNAYDLAECVAVLRRRAPELDVYASHWSTGGWTAYVYHPVTDDSVAVLDHNRPEEPGTLDVSFVRPGTDRGWLLTMRCRPAEALTAALDVRAGQPITETPNILGRRPIWRPS